MTKKKASPAANPATVAKASARSSSPDTLKPSAVTLQLQVYEQGIQFFSGRNFEKALASFREAVKGPAPHIADKARSYASVCERRLNRVEVQLNTADDHFNYGVERMNARDVALAKQHLDQALKKQPDGDHILYTLALCCGIAGDGDAACDNLRRAIELEPRNRILARQDPEFAVLASQLPQLRALLSAE